MTGLPRRPVDRQARPRAVPGLADEEDVPAGLVPNVDRRPGLPAKTPPVVEVARLGLVTRTPVEVAVGVLGLLATVAPVAGQATKAAGRLAFRLALVAKVGTVDSREVPALEGVVAAPTLGARPPARVVAVGRPVFPVPAVGHAVGVVDPRPVGDARLAVDVGVGATAVHVAVGMVEVVEAKETRPVLETSPQVLAKEAAPVGLEEAALQEEGEATGQTMGPVGLATTKVPAVRPTPPVRRVVVPARLPAEVAVDAATARPVEVVVVEAALAKAALAPAGVAGLEVLVATRQGRPAPQVGGQGLVGVETLARPGLVATEDVLPKTGLLAQAARTTPVGA